MSRDYLNKGHRIQDRTVLVGSVPEADPSLVAHGQDLPILIGSVRVSPPYLLVVGDFDGGVTPESELEFWGYFDPPAAGDQLQSNWQHISTVVMADVMGSTPTLALFPLVGLSRYAVVVKTMAGAPTGLGMRELAISEATAKSLIDLGLVFVGAGGSQFVVDAVPSVFADGTLVRLITDTERYLRTISKAHDTLLAADLTATVNPESANRDAAPQVICNETDLAASANFPSDAGIEIGDRDFLSFTLSLNDVTSVAFEVSNEGTNWADETESVVAEGASGHAKAYFTSAAGVTTLFACYWPRCGFRYVRCAVVIPNATNVIYIDLIQRAL